MAAPKSRRTILSVDVLEDRIVLSSYTPMPMEDPKATHLAAKRSHVRGPGKHHGKHAGRRNRNQRPNPVIQVPQNPPPVNPPPMVASFFDVFVDLTPRGSPTNCLPGDQDRENARLARLDAAGWRDSAAGDTDPQRKAEKLNAAGNADKAADNWDKAGTARDNGDKDKADKLEQAARERENAAREWGANGDGKAAGEAEQRAQALEDQTK